MANDAQHILHILFSEGRKTYQKASSTPELFVREGELGAMHHTAMNCIKGERTDFTSQKDLMNFQSCIFLDWLFLRGCDVYFKLKHQEVRDALTVPDRRASPRSAGRALVRPPTSRGRRSNDDDSLPTSRARRGLATNDPAAACGGGGGGGGCDDGTSGSESVSGGGGGGGDVDGGAGVEDGDGAGAAFQSQLISGREP